LTAKARKITIRQGGAQWQSQKWACGMTVPDGIEPQRIR